MPMLQNSLVDSWEPQREVSKWADHHKFGPSIPMTDRALRELAKTHSGKPAGLYIWECADHGIYIGISNTSVVTRLRQHVKNYQEVANIQSFRYRAHPGSREALREVERDLIYDALDHGFKAFNREHSAVIYGDSVFDTRIAATRQAQWFANPLRSDICTTATQSREPTQAEVAKSTKTFDKFSKMSEAPAITEAIALYLRACTPFPAETESEYWSLTCLPSWSGGRRLVTLNMGFLEMFYVNRNTKKGRIEICMGTDFQFLPRRRDWWKLRRLGARKYGPIHAAGMPNEEVLRFSTVESFVAVMTTSEEVRLAGARFALDRMRKGRVSGRYRDAHNALLARAALDRTDYWDQRNF